MKMDKGGESFPLLCSGNLSHLAMTLALRLVSRWLLLHLPKSPVISFSCLLRFQRNRIEYNLLSIISDNFTLLRSTLDHILL